MHRILLLLVAVVLFPSSLRAEKIHYSIQAGIKLGEADLIWVGDTIYRGRKTVQVIFRAQGFNFYDEEKLFLDPISYKPLFVERIYNDESIFEEYHASGEIKIQKTVAGKTTQTVINKSTAADNIYGFIFWYRKNGSFKTGDVVELHLPTKDLKIQLVKQVPLKLAQNNYQAYYLQSMPSKYKIWFDHSDKKIPLKINGALGSMVMTKYEE